MPEYDVTVNDKPWTYVGELQRATFVFDDDSHMTIHWEQSKDGKTWMPLCNLKATKIK